MVNIYRHPGPHYSLHLRLSSGLGTGSHLYIIYTCKIDSFITATAVLRPSHLKIPDGPKMAHAALSRRAIDGPCAVIYRLSGTTPVCCLAARRATTYGPYRPPLDGPFRRAKNGPSQMRRPGCAGSSVC